MSNGKPKSRASFNTQPPEGGWLIFRLVKFADKAGFNTQPPEGGWESVLSAISSVSVSTHSRPKAAGLVEMSERVRDGVSTHSRPKAAG